jgi:hypothetical protein
MSSPQSYPTVTSLAGQEKLEMPVPKILSSGVAQGSSAARAKIASFPQDVKNE